MNGQDGEQLTEHLYADKCQYCPQVGSVQPSIRSKRDQLVSAHQEPQERARGALFGSHAGGLPS